MFREVLRKVCVRELRHTVIGEAADGREAVRLVHECAPDLVLLDLHLPGLNGFGVIAELQAAGLAQQFLVLSSHCDDYTVYRAEKLHVHGFVDKNTNTVAALKKAVAAVAAGGRYFSEEFLRLKAVRHGDPQSFDKVLTDRECEFLAMFGGSFHDREIAARFGVIEVTVEKHRFNILRKLGLRGRAELVRYAQDRGFTIDAPRQDNRALLP